VTERPDLVRLSTESARLQVSRTDGHEPRRSSHRSRDPVEIAVGGAVRWVPAAITALAAVTLLWTRLIPLNNSLIADEALDVIHYIRPGPAAAFGSGPFPHYLPDDHILFNLLTWASTNIVGDFSNAAYRFWGVVPALAAVAILTWWLWRHFDGWVAAIFIVIAAVSPLYSLYGPEARGYGLAFLAGVLTCLAANAYFHEGRGRALALFGVAGAVGIFTLPDFVLAFFPLAGILLLRPARRRGAILVAALVGLVSILFYLPVLGGVLHSAGQHFGIQLPWDGVVTGPLHDLLAPSVQLLVPHLSLTVAEVIAACVLAVGAIALWVRPERFLLLAIVTPPLFGYLVLEVGRFYVENRFLSFVLLPLLALAAIGLVFAGRLLARARPLAVVSIALAIAFSLFTLVREDTVFRAGHSLPIQNFEDAAAVARDAKVSRLVTNYECVLCYGYYLGRLGRSLELLSPPELEHMFCTDPAAFVYLEYDAAPIPGRVGATIGPPADTTCLRQRDAVRVPVAQQAPRDTNVVWIVPP
jgi:hypothetical protein